MWVPFLSSENLSDICSSRSEVCVRSSQPPKVLRKQKTIGKLEVPFKTTFGKSGVKTTYLIINQIPAGYASVITRSKSASSVNNATGPETGNMLKDLDTALKASTNYIENHRSTQLPNGGHQEYHEYRSSTTSATPGDFNLEKQVILNFCKWFSYMT